MISGTTTIPFLISKQSSREIAPRRLYVDGKKDFFVLKRIFDIVVSALFILFILTWLFPLLAFVILVDSRGPVLFVQRRVGRAGKSFKCYKFRTMVSNPEADMRPAIVGDPRVTAIGKFLREYNIDEFPQFLNVLLGNMSIVGPRPHMFSDCAAYSSKIPGYKFRTFVKPGITGLAQAHGFHGPAIDPEMLHTRFKLDAYYVQHASIELDIRIIYATVARRMRQMVAKSSQ